jgi:hypothetical protein
MALLEQHGFDTAWTRLARFWPVARASTAADFVFCPRVVTPDADAMARATALYTGQAVPDGDGFANLHWFKDFASSGRVLMVSHGLWQLEGWLRRPPPVGDVASEAARLCTLAAAAGPAARLLTAPQLAPLTAVFAFQVERLSRLRTRTVDESLTKAQALVMAARALVDGKALLGEAAALLDHTVPLLIGPEGGPTGLYTDYVVRVQALLQATEVPRTPAVEAALDRARPYLAMLRGSDGHYVGYPGLEVHGDVASTAALRLAPSAGVARLQAAKAVVIATPAEVMHGAALHVSSHGRPLLSASLLQTDSAEHSDAAQLSVRDSAAGQMLHKLSSSGERMVFLASVGDDLRVEDRLARALDGARLCFRPAPGVRVSLARSGGQATLARDARHVWQLTLRGARLTALAEDGCLWAVSDATGEATVNWALKRMAKVSAKSAGEETAELPF